jgi:vitamin B12 transporter
MSVRSVHPAALALAAACFACLSSSPAVHAETASNAPERDPGRVDQIIVSASRVPTPVERVNQPVEAYNRDDIERRQAHVLNDLLIGAPGIALARAGGPGTVSELRVRGAETRHVLVLIDGVDANDPAIGSTVDLSHISLAGAERVEILRGPQSAVWGTDALAGVITIDTVARPDTTSGRVHVESGSYGTNAVTADVRTGNGGAWLGAGGHRFRTDGINIAGDGGERDGYRNDTLFVNAGYDGDRWSIGAIARYVDAVSEYDPTSPITSRPIDGDREFTTRKRFARAFGTFEAVPGWNQTLSLAYTGSDNANFADGARTNRSEGERLRVGYQNDWYFGVRDQRLTLALEHQREDFTFRAPASAWGDPNQDQRLASTSAIVEYDVTFNVNFGLTISGRADRNSEFGNATAGRASLRYERPDWGSRVFASLGTGVNNPTFTERFGFTPDTFIGNPSLEPERSVSAQLTLEQQLTPTLAADVAVFRDRLIDEIDGFAFDPAAGGFTALNRDGRSRRQGIEAAMRLQALEGLQLTAAYGYLDATEPSAGGQLRELRRPRHTGRLIADASLLSDRLQVQLGAGYVGRRFDNDFATFPAAHVTLDAYWLVHTTARYHLNDRWAVFGRVENALDESYQTVLGYHTPGRSAFVGLTARL